MKSLNLIVFLKSIWSHCFLVATCCSAPFTFIFVLIKVKNMWRRWGTSQNFFIAFTDELEKQIFKYLLKKLLKWASKKNKIILIFTILHSFLKIKKTSGDIIILYHVPKILMIWSTVPETGKQRNRMKYIILGVFCSFHRTPPHSKNQENQNFEMMKILRDIIMLRMCTKNHNHKMYGVWGTEWDRQIFFFLSFRMILKIKIFKKWEKLLKILSFYTCPR